MISLTLVCRRRATLKYHFAGVVALGDDADELWAVRNQQGSDFFSAMRFMASNTVASSSIVQTSRPLTARMSLTVFMETSFM